MIGGSQGERSVGCSRLYIPKKHLTHLLFLLRDQRWCRILHGLTEGHRGSCGGWCFFSTGFGGFDSAFQASMVRSRAENAALGLTHLCCGACRRCFTTQRLLRSTVSAVGRESFLSGRPAPREKYSQLASQDLRPSEPNRWKILQHYLSTKGCPGHPTLGTNIVQEILVIRMRCRSRLDAFLCV